MKKKLLSALLCVAMVSTILSGCGGAATEEAAADTAEATEETTEEATEEAATEETAEVEPEAVTTVGDANGTHMEMWSFVELHNSYYGKMVEMWNAANPDRTTPRLSWNICAAASGSPARISGRTSCRSSAEPTGTTA